jgi:predicted transglutaminase-like cysteine proteinase
MLRIVQPRAFPRALGLVLALSFVAAGSTGASAKARVKKMTTDFATSATSFTDVTPPQARFFTINSVLAKHDGLRSNSGAMQLASTDSSSGSRSKVISDMPPAAAMAPVSDEPFGLVTFRAPEGLLWVKWRGIQAKSANEAQSIQDCKADDDRCSPAEKKFIALARAAAGVDPRAKIEIINRSVNQAIRYVSDFEQHGVADFWSSPLQTLRAGMGDCEDYAIAKRSLLLAAGVAEADLKLLLVRDLAVRQDHAVLAVRLDGRWLVLDNRRSALLEGRDVQSFMPLFAIDDGGVSLFAAPYAERARHESESEMFPAAEAEATLGAGGGRPLVF